VHEPFLLQCHEKAIDCFGLFFVNNHLTHRVVILAGRDGDTELLRLEHASTLRIRNDSFTVLAGCANKGLPLVQALSMTRKRNGIRRELMCMVKARNSHQEAFIA
jgi:hypothetical protein